MLFLIKLKQALQSNYKIIIIVLLTIILSIIRITNKKESNYKGNENEIIGKINNYSYSHNKLSLNILAKDKLIGTYYLKSKKEQKQLFNKVCLGCTIICNGKMEQNNNNPIPNNFNYKKYLEHKNIYYSFKIEKFEIKKDNNLIYKIKDLIIKRIYKYNYKDYLMAFIVGDKSLLDKNEYTLFRNNGIAHLLAISGMHAGIFLIILNKLFQLLKIKHSKIITIILLLFFAFLIGFTSSINRVVIFYILKNLNIKLKSNYSSSLKILFFTICIELLINPLVIYDVGFLYSHIITFGILYNKKLLNGNYIVKLFKVSIISLIYSLPITALLNYEINLMSIITNIVFVPFISFIIYPFSLFTFIIPNPLYNKFINILNILNNFFDNIKIMINIPKLNIALIIIYYLNVLIVKKHSKLIFNIVLILLINKLNFKLNKDYYAYFFDVGQGDSATIVYPYQKGTIMIDTGGKIPFKNKLGNITNNFHISDNIILFFKSIGINKLNYLIITHGDYDHIGEAINLINNFKVENVIFNIGDYNKLELNLIKVLKEKHIPYYQNVESLNLENNKLYFLNTKVYDNENDNSSVIYTKINNKKILLMGDAGKAKELDIINKYNIKDIDILKVGHHGSNTSSSIEFIDVIKPKKCIISVGKNNHFGHPKESVIDTLTNYCDIYRTDVNGSISIN